MRNKHTCDLRKNQFSNARFERLRPNATVLEKLRVKIKMMTTLDMNNWNSQDFFITQSLMRSEVRRHLSGSNFIVHNFSKCNTFYEILSFFIWLFRYWTFMASWHAMFIIITPLLRVLQATFVVYQFFLAYVDPNKREIVIEPKKVAWHYLRTFFAIDVIVIFCDGITIDQLDDISNVIKTVAYIAAIMMRFPHNNKRLHEILLHFQLHKAIIFLIDYAYLTSFILHYLTMALILMSTYLHQNNQPVDGWIHITTGFTQTKPMNYKMFANIYCNGLLMMMCYFCGIGYSTQPQMPEEDVMLGIVSIFGRLYTLTLFAKVLDAFGYSDLSQSHYERFLTEMKEYSMSKNLPKILYVKLVKLFDYKYQKCYFDEKEIFSTLTEQLKSDISLHCARKLIGKVGPFRTMPLTDLAGLFSHMNSRIFLPNEVVKSCEQTHDVVYIISSGSVALYLDFHWELRHFNDGDEFGLIDMFYLSKDCDRLRYVAIECSEIFMIKKKYLLACFNQYPDVKKYFKDKANERFKMIHDKKRNLGSDLLSQMNAGTLLEEPRLRPFVFS